MWNYDITYVTKHDIANVLNSYFVNIGKRTSESMNAGPYDHYQYLKGNFVNSLFFAPVSSADVEEIILSFRNKPGNINTFSTSVLKRIRRHVSYVLCHIINLSLRTGIFPNCLKWARGLPYQKAVIQLMPSTTDQYQSLYYIPIFILYTDLYIIYRSLYYIPIFILYTDLYIIYRSLIKYLKKLYINSYTHILIKIIYFMRINMVSENICLLCKHYWIICNLCATAYSQATLLYLHAFLDFKKEFDTVDHKILLSKLDV